MVTRSGYGDAETDFARRANQFDFASLFYARVAFSRTRSPARKLKFAERNQGR
jgi:hypothetical protein